MKAPVLTKNESTMLAVLAGIGLVVPNGVFLYYAATDRALLGAAMANPISLVFMLEAFFLVFLFAWLLRKVGSQKPTGLLFVILSIVGSLAFSVPLTLRSLFRQGDGGESAPT